MSAFIDEVGHRYGRLRVLEYAGTLKGVAYFTVQCDCSTTSVIIQFLVVICALEIRNRAVASNVIGHGHIGRTLVGKSASCGSAVPRMPFAHPVSGGSVPIVSDRRPKGKLLLPRTKNESVVKRSRTRSPRLAAGHQSIKLTPSR
jgi:hypothetical protein